MSENHFLRRRWKLILNIVTILALVGLVYALRDEILTTIENVGRVNTWALALMLPIEFLNYDAYARMYRSFFGILGDKVTYKEMMKVSLELNLVNHIFPSGGVSGFSYFGLRLKKIGISSGKATLVQTMRFIFLFLSFEILLVVGLLSLAIGGSANNLTILVAASLSTLLIVGTALLAFIIGSKQRIRNFFTFFTKAINRAVKAIFKGNREIIETARVENMLNDLHENYLVLKSDYSRLKQPFFNAFMANLTEILAVYVVYVAFGHWINPGAIILAYALANFAGLISVLPGGIGIYEAIMTAVLAVAGVPASVSIPVTVMYRVINITIQVIPGYYFYHKALRDESPVQQV
jgi:uncharacterized protein (TIRG00374 family)